MALDLDAARPQLEAQGLHPEPHDGPRGNGDTAGQRRAPACAAARQRSPAAAAKEQGCGDGAEDAGVESAAVKVGASHGPEQEEPGGDLRVPAAAVTRLLARRRAAVLTRRKFDQWFRLRQGREALRMRQVRAAQRARRAALRDAFRLLADISACAAGAAKEYRGHADALRLAMATEGGAGMDRGAAGGSGGGADLASTTPETAPAPGRGVDGADPGRPARGGRAARGAGAAVPAAQEGAALEGRAAVTPHGPAAGSPVAAGCQEADGDACGGEDGGGDGDSGRSGEGTGGLMTPPPPPASSGSRMDSEQMSRFEESDSSDESSDSDDNTACDGARSPLRLRAMRPGLQGGLRSGGGLGASVVLMRRLLREQVRAIPAAPPRRRGSAPARLPAAVALLSRPL